MMRHHLFAVPLLALVTLLLACAGAPPPARPAYAPLPLSPKGETDWPITFTWTRVPAGDWVYRVTVVDAAERTLAEIDTRDTHLSAPDDLRPMLTPGQPFTWRVVIIGEDGKPLTQATAVSLTLR